MIKDTKAYQDKRFEADYKEASSGLRLPDASIKLKPLLKNFWLLGFQAGITTGFSEAKEIVSRTYKGERL